jgi:hypothetical protein
MDIAVDLGLPRRSSVIDLGGLTNWRAAPAAELLRPRIDDIILPKAARAKLKRLWDHILMASGKSSYLSAAQRNEVFGAVAFAAPGTDYFALWTTTAGTDMDAYVGNTAGEVSGGSYDRVAKTNNTTNFATISGDTAKVNTTAITWTTASANWNSSAVIPQLGVFDGNLKTAADNLLVWADFTVAKAILSGDTAQINASAFSYTDE